MHGYMFKYTEALPIRISKPYEFIYTNYTVYGEAVKSVVFEKGTPMEPTKIMVCKCFFFSKGVVQASC